MAFFIVMSIIAIVGIKLGCELLIDLLCRRENESAAVPRRKTREELRAAERAEFQQVCNELLDTQFINANGWSCRFGADLTRLIRRVERL